MFNKKTLVLLTLFFSGLTILSVTVSGDEYTLNAEVSPGTGFPLVTANTADRELGLLDPDGSGSQWFFLIDGTPVFPYEDGWERRRVSDSSRLTMRNRLYTFTWNATRSGGGRHILISAAFRNNGTETVEVAPGILVDTWLGEDNLLHFSLPDGSYVRNETEFVGGDIPEWLKTVRDAGSPDLTLILDKSTASRPERIVLGNWRRLQESAADYETVNGRNFDYLPFSENDSAVLLEYASEKLQGGESLILTIALGLDEYIPSGSEFEDTATNAISAELENIRLREYTVRRRLTEIGTILEDIDALLKSGSIDADALRRIETEATKQEKLQSEYEEL